MGAWALGEPRSHIATCKRSPEGRTVGVMLRLTPIEDPKTWKEDTPSPDTPNAPQGQRNPKEEEKR